MIGNLGYYNATQTLYLPRFAIQVQQIKLTRFKHFFPSYEKEEENKITIQYHPIFLHPLHLLSRLIDPGPVVKSTFVKNSHHIRKIYKSVTKAFTKKVFPFPTFFFLCNNVNFYYLFFERWKSKCFRESFSGNSIQWILVRTTVMKFKNCRIKLS